MNGAAPRHYRNKHIMCITLMTKKDDSQGKVLFQYENQV